MITEQQREPEKHYQYSGENLLYTFDFSGELGDTTVDTQAITQETLRGEHDAVVLGLNESEGMVTATIQIPEAAKWGDRYLITGTVTLNDTRVIDLLKIIEVAPRTL